MSWFDRLVKWFNRLVIPNEILTGGVFMFFSPVRFFLSFLIWKVKREKITFHFERIFTNEKYVNDIWNYIMRTSEFFWKYNFWIFSLFWLFSNIEKMRKWKSNFHHSTNNFLKRQSTGNYFFLFICNIWRNFFWKWKNLGYFF